MTQPYDIPLGAEPPTTASQNQAEVPDYVWDLLKSWAEGSPLNFEGHFVPEVVQRYIERTISAEPKGFQVPVIISGMCKQFLDDTFGTNWVYMAPEQFNAGVRWIYGIAKNDLDLAKESLEEVHEFTQEKIQERDLGKTPQERSLGGQSRADSPGP